MADRPKTNMKNAQCHPYDYQDTCSYSLLRVYKYDKRKLVVVSMVRATIFKYISVEIHVDIDADD